MLYCSGQKYSSGYRTGHGC